MAACRSAFHNDAMAYTCYKFMEVLSRVFSGSI